MKFLEENGEKRLWRRHSVFRGEAREKTRSSLGTGSETSSRVFGHVAGVKTWAVLYTGQIHKNDILPLTKQAWVTCMVESWFSKFLALSLDVSLTLVIVQNMMLPGIDYFLQVHFPLCVCCVHDNHADGNR